ncbi:ecdysteroid kinase domain-containing protein [Phthorimaea operculella]|nr:ecdysteroid kinase domain-containing protein [Phthorimaea operculella]
MAELTLEFLQNILAEDYPDVTIHEFEGAPGSKRGDNYTSMVFRVTLKGIRKVAEADGSSEHEEPWEGSIIYKCLPDSILRREAFKSDELFCNEVAFYTKIWPAFSAFQAQWEKVKNPFKAIPKCYLAQNDLVVLKDLKRMDFVMPDRRKGLSIEQTYFVMKQLAQFHALSLAMKCDNPEGFYELLNARDGIFEVFFVAENQEYYRGYYIEAIRNAIEMVEEELADAEDKDHYLDKLKEFCDEETFFQRMVDLVAAKEPLAVITHGDCWTNNLLFRYVNGDIAESTGVVVDYSILLVSMGQQKRPIVLNNFCFGAIAV